MFSPGALLGPKPGTPERGHFFNKVTLLLLLFTVEFLLGGKGFFLWSPEPLGGNRLGGGT